MKIIITRRGGTYLLVIAVFVMISMLTAALLSRLSQNIYQLNLHAHKLQAFYLNQEAEDAAVTALLDDNCSLLTMLASASEQGGGVVWKQKMNHKDREGNKLGTSELKLSVQKHPYGDEMEDWAVVYVDTSFTGSPSVKVKNPCTYKGSVMLLVRDPDIRYQNVY